MNKQITFYGEPELKKSLLLYTKQHQEADAYIRGDWVKSIQAANGSFKGCFYGCMTQSKDNTLGKASEQYGLPLWYVHVTEKIYEGLPENEWLKFPYQAIEVLPVGIDTNEIRSLWNYRLLKDQLRFSDGNKEVENAVKQCMELFKVGFDIIDCSAAGSAAELAAWSARSASSAASSAESAARSAESAARSAGSGATSAAWSATSAAWSATSAAWSASSAASSAESAYYSFQRDLLFDCIKVCSEKKEQQLMSLKHETITNK